MRFINYIAVLLTACSFLLSACSRQTTEEKPAPDFIPVKTSQDGKWGMLSPEGKLLFSDRYENEPSLALEGVFSVKEGDSFNLYTAESNPTKINKRPLVAVGNYADGLVPATFPGERIKILDKKGDEVATLMPVDGHELVKSDVAFHDGLLVVTTPDGKFGYVNEKGEAVVKPVYDAALPFAFGYAMVAKVTDPQNPSGSLKVYIIDRKGDQVLAVSSQYTVVDLDLENERLIVTDINGRMGFLSFDDEFTQLPASVKNIGQIKDGVFVYANENGLCGVMTFDYKSVLEPKYQHTEIVDADKFIVTTGPEWDLAGRNGETISKFGQADLVGYMKGFGYLVYDVKTSRLVGEDGKPKGKLTLFAVGLNPSSCSSVRSDYKSAERIAGDLASIPSPAGVAHLAWGTAAAQIAPAADNGTGIYAALPQASISGVDYLLNAIGVFTAPVGTFASAPAEDGAPAEGFTYNPEALLCGVDFYFRSEAPITKHFVNSLKTAYAKNGFKQTRTAGDNCFMLENNLTCAIFCIPLNGHDANFFLCSRGKEELISRWWNLLSAAGEKGGVPQADTLFGHPSKSEPTEDAGYVDRSQRPATTPGADSGERVSTR